MHVLWLAGVFFVPVLLIVVFSAWTSYQYETVCPPAVKRTVAEFIETVLETDAYDDLADYRMFEGEAQYTKVKQSLSRQFILQITDSAGIGLEAFSATVETESGAKFFLMLVAVGPEGSIWSCNRDYRVRHIR